MHIKELKQYNLNGKEISLGEQIEFEDDSMHKVCSIVSYDSVIWFLMYDNKMDCYAWYSVSHLYEKL